MRFHTFGNHEYINIESSEAKTNIVYPSGSIIRHSVRVVFLESICADTTILRWYFTRWQSASVNWNLWASEGGGVSLAACDGDFTAAAAAAEAWRRTTDNGRKSALCARQS
jgi:hypothetical protein